MDCEGAEYELLRTVHGDIYIYIYVPCDMGPRFGQFLRKDIGLIDLYV